MAISVASRSRGACSRPTIRPISRSISRAISVWMSVRFFSLRPRAGLLGIGAGGADRVVDRDELIAQGTKLLVGIHLALELVEPGSCSQLHRPGLAGHLHRVGVVGAMTGMVAPVAGAAGLPTAAERLRDRPLAHVAQLSDLTKDAVALGLEGSQGGRHGHLQSDSVYTIR